TAGLFRFVIARGKRAHGGKAADAHGRDGSLAPTGNHHVRIAALNDLVCVANGMSAGGAGSCSGFIGAFGAIPDAYVAGSQVHDGSRNEKWRYFARTALQ